MKHTIAALALALAACSSAPPAAVQDAGPAKPPPAPLTLELYDVTDLANDVPDYPGPGEPPAANGTQLAASLARGLVSAGGVEVKNGLLVVKAAEPEQHSIGGALGMLRRRKEFLVTVQARFVTTGKALDGNARLHSALLPSAVVDRLVASTERGSVLSAPRLTCVNAQRSHIVIASQLAYIKGYEVRFNRAGEPAPDPEVGVANIGLAVGVRPALLGESGPVLLGDLRIALSEPRLDPPKVDSVRTPFGVVERPDVMEHAFVLNPVLRADETLVVGPLPRPWSKSADLWVVVSCTTEKAEEK